MEKKIYRKEVEDEIRAKAEKKMISHPLKKSKGDGTFWESFETGVRPLGFASLDSMFRNCTYEESQQILKQAFQGAAEQYELPVEKLKFVKGWGQGSQIQGFRLETDEELEKRIQYETDSKVTKLRMAKTREATNRASKKRQIKKLEDELAKLKK
jgi:hypothetical protein